MRILVWSGKHGDVMVAASTPEEEERAWLYLFKLMESNGYYHGLDEDEVKAHAAAKNGNWKGAKWLLEMHSGYEYEQVNVEYAVRP